jgi:hypothetical protein
MSLRRKVRPAGAAARRASLRWWLLNLAATGATLTAAAALLAVSLHVSTTAASSSALAGEHYLVSQVRVAICTRALPHSSASELSPGDVLTDRPFRASAAAGGRGASSVGAGVRAAAVAKGGRFGPSPHILPFVI